MDRWTEIGAFMRAGDNPANGAVEEAVARVEEARRGTSDSSLIGAKTA